MGTDYAKMTIKELGVIGRSLREQKAAIREEQCKVKAEITRKTAEEDARKKIDSMSETEKKALRRALGPGGVRKN